MSKSKKWLGGIIRGGAYYISRKHPLTGVFCRLATGASTPAGALEALRVWEADPAGKLRGVHKEDPADADLKTLIEEYLGHSKSTNSARHVGSQERGFTTWFAYLAALDVPATVGGLTPKIATGFIQWRRGGALAKIRAEEEAKREAEVEALRAECAASGSDPRLVRSRRRRAYPVEVGEAAVNRELAYMKALFTWAIETQRLPRDSDPFRYVHLLRENHDVNPHRYVERDDILAARKELEPKWADCVTVLYGSAFRYDSVARLAVGSVIERTSLLRDPTPKGKRGVEIVVSPEVLAAAKRILARSVPDEHGHSEKLPQDEAQQLGRRLRSACRRAGVDRFTAHDLRVSAATWLHEECGWSMATLQGHLGHANIRTTEHYVRARAPKGRPGAAVGPI